MTLIDERHTDRGLDVRDPFALALEVECLWDRAHGDPRFRELLERVGLVE